MSEVARDTTAKYKDLVEDLRKLDKAVSNVPGVTDILEDISFPTMNDIKETYKKVAANFRDAAGVMKKETGD